MTARRRKIVTNRVLAGDCLQVLAGIPDNSVDMCFADPPFNLNKKYSSYGDRRAVDEYLAWCRLWLEEMARVTKPTGAIFVHNIPKWLTHFAAVLNDCAHFRHWIAWHATGRPLGKTLLPSHYGILFYSKSPTDFKFYDLRAPHTSCRVCGEFLKDYGGKENQRHPFGALVGDVWTDIHRIRHNRRRDPHPCQLPPHLLERLILMSTDPGDVVLDPFLGTGTTAIAAKTLGRKYIGIELDKKYQKIAEQKIKNAAPSKYRGVFVSRYLDQIVSIRDVDSNNLFGKQLTAPEKKRALSSHKPLPPSIIKRHTNGHRLGRLL